MGSQSSLWRIISTAPKTVSQKSFEFWLFSHKRQRLQISMSDNPMGMHIPFLLASMWERDRDEDRERESARTTIWDSTHGSVCVCLKHWMKMTPLHAHWWWWGGSANIYRDVRGVSLSLPVFCWDSQYCLERICSVWNHDCTFLGSFPHIPTLWHAVHLEGIVHPVTAAPAATEPVLFLFCALCCVYLPPPPSSGGWRVE